MKLRVLSDYRSAAGAYVSGEQIDVTDEEGEFLLRDSPGSFVTVEGTASGITAVDRRARGGRVR